MRCSKDQFRLRWFVLNRGTISGENAQRSSVAYELLIGIIDRLESPTRSLQIQAPLGVAVESQAGDIAATCYEDLRLRSTGGAVSDLFTALRDAPSSLITK